MTAQENNVRNSMLNLRNYDDEKRKKINDDLSNHELSVNYEILKEKANDSSRNV